MHPPRIENTRKLIRIAHILFFTHLYAAIEYFSCVAITWIVFLCTLRILCTASLDVIFASGLRAFHIFIKLIISYSIDLPAAKIELLIQIKYSFWNWFCMKRRIEINCHNFHCIFSIRIALKIEAEMEFE